MQSTRRNPVSSDALGSMPEGSVPVGDHVHQFGAFTLDVKTGELRKHGTRIRLSDQPFRVLSALLEQHGELVTREQLRERIWPGAEAGDFEQGLNRAVSKLRGVLNDSAVSPRYIETLTGRGYRFIGVLERPPEKVAEPLPEPKKGRFLLVASILFGIGALAIIAKLLIPPGVPVLRWRKLTTDVYAKSSPVLSDGRRIYFSASFGGEQFIAEAPVSGGHPTRMTVTPPGPSFALQDLSPNGQEFLLAAAARGDRRRPMPLWTLNIGDGSARRVGSAEATSAAYSPSGLTIAYTTPSELWVCRSDGSQPIRLVEVKDHVAESVSWSPNGRKIRFTRRDPLSNFASPWEVNPDGSGLRKLLSPSPGQSLASLGWALNGRIGIFFGSGAYWARPESFFTRNAMPTKLGEDAPEFVGLARLRLPDSFNAIGTDRLGELQAYDQAKNLWNPVLDGISAEAAEFSPDGERVAYVTYPQKTLWVRQADGKRPIQLTSAPFEASFPRWSPDGRRIAFSAGESPEQPMRLYLVDADGGPARPAIPSAPGSQGYPSWSPDGKTLIYGIVNTSLREEVYIRVADLATGKVTKLEGSEGLFAPRWSPDGRTIAALRFNDERTLLLMTVKDRHWREARGTRVDWPAWAPDSQSLICKSGDSIMRYRVSSGKFEPVTTLIPEQLGGYSRWTGIDAHGAPLRTLNLDSRQVYSLQLDSR